MLLTLLLNVTFSFSQNDILDFQILDEKTREPIQFSFTVIKGKNISSISDENGYTKIQTNKSDTLVIYRLGYFLKKITPLDISTNNRIVLLKPKAVILEEVVVKSNKTDTFLANNNIVFLDFDFYDDYILAIVNKGKKYNSLMLLDLDGNKIVEKKLSIKSEALFKDCFENIHLITIDSVYQAYYNYQNITLLKPYHINKYYGLLKPCECYYGNKHIFKIVQYHQLKNTYYLYDDKNKQIIADIADSSAIIGFNSDYNLNYFLSQRRMNAGYSTSVSEISKHIDQLRAEIVLSPTYANLLRPIESELKRIDSNLVLFDYTNKFIYTFTFGGKLLSKSALNNFAGINPKIHLDYDSHNLIFSKTNSNGVLTLYKFDINKNIFTHKFELKKSYSLKKFKIKENQLYFINRDMTSELTKSKIVKELIIWQTL